MHSELSPRVLGFGLLIGAATAAIMPYVVLKMGMSVDLTFAGMFLAAALLAKSTPGKELAPQLNIIQTMVSTASGVGFMCVILAAFYYIQGVFGRPIGFDPSWWQISIWLFFSATLGVFMSVPTRSLILNDKNLPWPTGHAVLSVTQTLTNSEEGEQNERRRSVLYVSTALAGFGTFMRDGLGLVPHIVANPKLAMSLGLEFGAVGLGMMIPLSVGLSGLLGVWIVNAFGEQVAILGALAGTAPEHLEACKEELTTGIASDFLVGNCGQAKDYLTASSHFRWVVQWFMWPATAMMITASLTSVVIPMLSPRAPGGDSGGVASKADETVPKSWVILGIAGSIGALLVIQGTWFEMPWHQLVVAVGVQPILIIAGARVLALTGQGPVSLMANATQFVFGLLYPNHIKQNLVAAHTSADPQASSEASITAFWVARFVGGKFSSLILAQLIVLPVSAIILPLTFSVLSTTYGIGLEPGQLSAPTGLKIATLAMVMERGVSALPPGALSASLVAGAIGIVVEALLFVRKRDAEGNETTRFWWLPIPSALGFALILPPTVTLGLTIGSVISATWRAFSKSATGSFALYGAPAAAGLVAGEAIIGAALIPALTIFLGLLG